MAIIKTAIAVATLSFIAFSTQARNHQQVPQEEIAQAKAQWRAENGIYQPNLTPAAEQEALAFVAKKQKELNDENKKSRTEN